MTVALLHATHGAHTFWEFVWENTQHAFTDTLPLLPWLLLIYVVLQLLENKTNLAGSNRLGGKLGPVIGAATGLIPQCGFSVLAAKLYEQKYITVGTLLAIFLSTSDEAFIIMLSSGSADAAISVLSMVAVKVAVGIAVGYAADGILRWIGKGQVRLQAHAIDTVTGAKKPETVRDIFMLRYFEDMGAADGCSCGREHDDSRPFMTYVVGPVLHALQITALMFIFNFLMGSLLHFIGEDNFAAFMDRHLYLQPVLVSLVGLIPNCASSVFITSAYLEGTIAFGSCVAGLCANAGLGFVVLLRNTHKWKRNLLLIGVLYGVAVAVGLLCNLIMTLL